MSDRNSAEEPDDGENPRHQVLLPQLALPTHIPPGIPHQLTVILGADSSLQGDEDSDRKVNVHATPIRTPEQALHAISLAETMLRPESDPPLDRAAIGLLLDAEISTKLVGPLPNKNGYCLGIDYARNKLRLFEGRAYLHTRSFLYARSLVPPPQNLQGEWEYTFEGIRAVVEEWMRAVA